MAFEVLSADGADRSRWLDLIARLPEERRDIHYLPEYGSIYQRSYGHEPRLSVYEEDGRFVVQPFIIRALAPLPFLAAGGDTTVAFDIANAYGYGGPLVGDENWNAAVPLYREFLREFGRWTEQNAIASEFCSLHPLIPGQCTLIDGVIAADYVKDIVFINLEVDEAERLRHVRKGHRSSIALARRSGVRIARSEPTADALASFNTIYLQTMRRRDAAERWFFPESHFQDIVDELGSDRVSLFFAYVGDALESGCVVLHAFHTAYYHLAGTNAAHPNLGVNNLMVWEAANWCADQGFRRLYLGGGTTSDPEDPLLRFKAGFSNDRAALRTYFAVRSPRLYESLCAAKRRHERDTLGAEVRSGYLPLYRREA